MRRFVGLFDTVIAGLAMTVLVALLGVVTLGIVTRAIGSPFSWTDEMSGFIMVWLACLGWIVTTRRGAHIRIRYFHDKFPGPLWRGTEVAIQAALVVFGIVIALGGVHLVRVNHDIEAISVPISTAWMYVPLIPAGLTAFVQGVCDLWHHVRHPRAAGGALP